MKAAAQPRSGAANARLLHVDPQGAVFSHHRFSELPDRLLPGDLLVVNDAATLPASLRVRNLDAELRLVARRDDEVRFLAVLFGPGDHRTPTEQRAPAPRVRRGDRLDFGAALSAEVSAVDALSPRLVEVEFSLSGAELWMALYALGRPIQYAHVAAPVALWDVQNRFSSRPWAFEQPSAGRPIDGELLLGLRERGVTISWLTHASGISSTGSAELDARLPFPERFEIPERTRKELELARARGGRIVAVGTTVVRALEASRAQHGSVRSGPGEAELVIGPSFRPRVVDGLITGLHEPGSSHFRLLLAFTGQQTLLAALASAERRGYLGHEFGDSCLILASGPAARLAA